MTLTQALVLHHAISCQACPPPCITPIKHYSIRIALAKQMIPLHRPRRGRTFARQLPSGLLMAPDAGARSPQTDAALRPILLQLLPPLIR